MDCYTLPPLRIPHTLAEPLHDLSLQQDPSSLRLNRAYERWMAFADQESEVHAALFASLMAAANKRNHLQNSDLVSDETLQRAKDFVDAHYQRFDDLASIKEALLYELNQAKLNNGQGVPPLRKPKRTINEWDTVLKSF